MNKLALFSLTALTISAFAEDEIAAQKKSDKKMMEQKKMEQKQMDNMVVLNSANPASDNGWYLFGDALYWHASVGSTDWSLGYEDTSLPVAQGSLHHVDFKWNWGFRVGVGMNMDHDKWDTNLYYTWFQASHSNEVSAPATGEVFDNVGTVNSVTSGSLDWRIHFNMFDWELGRNFYVSKNLAVRPHVGLKGGWINQKVDVDYTQGTTAQGTPGGSADTDLHNNFWGIGASGGVNTLWVLGTAGMRNQHRFSLFGDFAGAFMYGHFSTGFKQEVYDAQGVLTGGGYDLDNLSRNLEVTMLEGMLGLSWDTAFNKDCCHFTFRAGYEFQYWFRQNQFIQAVGGGGGQGVASNALRHSDDLGLQGLTLDFRFDF